MTATLQVERTLSALLKARDEVERTIKAPVPDEPRFPWRNYEDNYEVDTNLLNRTLADLDTQIIEIERAAYRDPEQDAEMRAEMYAEMAITGVRDDPALYMHTPHEERLFQERIAHEVNYGYHDPEDGWVDGIYGDAPAVGNCPTCNRSRVWFEDELIHVDGYDTCWNGCSDEAISFMYFLGWLTNTQIDTGRFDSEFTFVTEDEDE
jgi:hypothetical protein